MWEDGMKTGKRISIKAEEAFYYLFFGIMFLAKGVGLDSGQRLFQLCALVSLTCFAIKLCLTRHTLKEWLTIALLVLLGIVMRHSSGKDEALWAMLILAGMKNVPLKRLMKLCAAIWGVTFTCSVVTGILHIRDGVVVVHEKLGLGPIVRWSWGYTHPNVLHVSYFIFVVLLLYVFAWRGKKLWKVSALLFAGNFFVFLYSVSYTGVLIVSGYLVLNLYLDCRKRLYLPESVLFTVAAALLILFPIVGPLWLEGHNHRLFMFLNELLSYRFELVYNIFHEHPVSAFGTNTVFTGNGRVTLDSSFAYLLMYYGVAGFTLFVAGFLYLVYHFGRTNRKKELAITLAIILAGVTEQFLFNLSFKNLLFFFLGEALFTDILRTGKKEGLWNRTFVLLPFGEKEVRFCLPEGLPAGVECMKRHGKQILVAGAVLAAVGAGLGGVVGKQWDSVYVSRQDTDYRSEERVTLDLDNLSEDFNSLVLGYRGPDGEMFELTGTIVRLERIRDLAGSAVVGGMAGIFLLAGGYIVAGWKRAEGKSAAAGR